MRLDWWTLGLQAVNFAILVWLLHRFLYKPVLGLIEARRAEVQREYDEARVTEDNAKARLAEVETQRAAIAAERRSALEAAATQAQQVAEARRAQADRELRALLDSGRKTLALERERALVEAQTLALDLGAEFAQRLLAEVPLPLRAEAWITRIEQYLNALAVTEREALKRQLADGSPLVVVTAASLPAPATDTWRKRLSLLLGEGIAVSFEVQPALIAGAELRLPTAVLHFSWKDTLALVRPIGDPRAHPR